MLWNDFSFLFRALSFLWLVPSGYEARFFYLNSLYIFLWVVTISIFFVVSSFLFFLP